MDPYEARDRATRFRKAMDEIEEITDASDGDEASWDEVMAAINDPRPPMPPNERERLQKAIQLLDRLRIERTISHDEYDLIFMTIGALVSHYRSDPPIKEVADDDAAGQ